MNLCCFVSRSGDGQRAARTCQLLKTDWFSSRMLELHLFVEVGFNGRPNTQRLYSLVF